MNKIRKRRIKNRIKRNKIKIIIIIVILFVLLLSVSYAAFNTILNINGKASIGDEKCKDNITGSLKVETTWSDNKSTTSQIIITINNNSDSDIVDWEAIISGPKDLSVLAFNASTTEDNGIITLKPVSYNSTIEKGSSIDLNMHITSVENPINIKYIKVNGCTIYGKSDSEELTSLKFNPSNYSLKIGEEQEYILQKTPSNFSGDINIKSSDENIVKINGNKIIGISNGSAEIIATYKNITTSALVTVSNEKIKVEKLDLSPKEYEMNIGDTITLNVTRTPENASGDITWTSSNNKVATADNGVIKAISAGEVTITASIDNISATSKIIVKENSTSDLDIDFKNTYNSNKDVQFKITLTNKSNNPIKYISLKFNLPEGTKWTYWGNIPGFKDSENGTVLTSTDNYFTIESGSYIEFTGMFSVPDGYDANNYTNPNITILKTK